MELQVKTNKKEVTELDRISHLPDCLLHQILYYLNTKSVVQTCVLSKPWKTLWTQIPTLKFDYNSYSQLLSPSFKDNGHKSQTSFNNFIIRVLSKHSTTNIHKLYYTSSKDHHQLPFLPEFLICYAASRNVQKLYINTFYLTASYDWNYCFSTCSSSLTHLQMACGFVDNWGVLALPTLKSLEIQCNWDERETNVNYSGINMFSGCPNLKSLVLADFLFQSVTISAPKHENLKLYASSIYQLTFPQLELLTPTLKNVNFVNLCPIVKSDSKFPCIQKVNIKLKDSYFETFTPKFKSNFIELLRVFRNAKLFTLPRGIKGWIKTSQPSQPEGNTTQLKMVCGFVDNWGVFGFTIFENIRD